jgi:16S rRNA (guanine966-N2)-methyltransferase
MRITGGTARGIPIHTGRAKHVRPATDRLREAVFSSLGERVIGAQFLDLFAGSGSYGLEALSRGAAGGLFVEKHPQTVQALEENLRAVQKSIGGKDNLSLHGGPGVKVIRRDVLRFTSQLRADLIFMDPPYDLARSDGDRLLQIARGCLAPEGILVYELPGDLEVPVAGWSLLRRLGKGGTNEPSVALLEHG